MIQIGTTNETTWTVAREHLASAFGSGLVDVLATPVLVGFCEECARTMVDGHLPPGQKTVGTSIQLDHLAATPLGMRVTLTARGKRRTQGTTLHPSFRSVGACLRRGEASF